MATHGIDVSKHNGVINWTRVKNSGKVDFAILRAGFGQVESQKDTKFEANYTGCVNNNIPVGVYWYSYAKTVDAAKAEANVCLKILNGRKLQYPVYWDFEEKSQLALGKTMVSAMAKAFCETIEAGGYTAGLYSMKFGLQNYIMDDLKQKYTQWVAHVNVQQTSYTGHDMWQYSWKGRIDGIVGDVDCSYCYKDFVTNIPTPEPVAPTKSITEVAQEVLDGKWGNGNERKKRLTEAGYNYAAVQAEVNRLLKQNAVVTKTYTVKRGDTLSAIASKYDTTVNKIVSNNKTKYPQIKPNFIKVGWVLTIK